MGHVRGKKKEKRIIKRSAIGVRTMGAVAPKFYRQSSIDRRPCSHFFWFSARENSLGTINTSTRNEQTNDVEKF